MLNVSLVHCSLQGKKWWQQTDEPWQALACCMEIAEATRSPNHEKFISHLPVHQVSYATLATNHYECVT